MNTLYIVHWMAGVIVLAEALNKLQRTDVFHGAQGFVAVLRGLAMVVMPWRWSLLYVITVFKAIGWGLLAIGSAAAMMAPLVHHMKRPDVPDVAVLAGFAVLIVRSRLRECYAVQKPNVAVSMIVKILQTLGIVDGPSQNDHQSTGGKK